jgi:hypothetical protein
VGEEKTAFIVCFALPPSMFIFDKADQVVTYITHASLLGTSMGAVVFINSLALTPGLLPLPLLPKP